MSANPVAYAENQLGVHAIWEHAKQELDDHRSAIEELKKIQASIGTARMNLEEREREVAATADVSEATSKTAVKELIKHAIDTDTLAIRLRKEIARLETEKAAYDLDARHAKYGVDLYSARLVELGGLLNFYAAAKTQSLSKG